VVADGFVGRVAELGELRSAADAATAGRGSLVLLAGEPGIGKTRLCDVVADHATSSGMAVHRAACWEGPSAPFWPWTQLLRAHFELSSGDAVPESVRALAGDVDVRTASDSLEADAESVRFALFDAITTFFHRASMRTPLVLVVDDLHWADLGSLRLLELFAREVRDASILVVGTYRDVEIDPGSDTGRAFDKLTDVGSTLRLEGLRATEVAELLQDSTGSLPATELARAVHGRTGGNPLFVRELGRLLAAQGRVDPQVATLPVPEGVRGVIRRRLARLSQGCHDLLGVASVLGAEFRLDVLSGVARLPIDDALTRLDEARDARLVVDVERSVGRWTFSHALVRDVLYDGIPLAGRTAIHQRAGELLEGSGAADRLLAEIAHHFVQAAPAGGVEKAIDYSIRAGRRALEQLAYEDAATQFRRAIDALDLAPDDDRRAELLLDLGDAQLRAGDMPAARATFDEAADAARRRSRPDELARAALGFGAGLEGFEIRMTDHRQIGLLEEALTALGPQDSSLRSWALARLSVALSYQESTERRHALAAEAVEMARRVDDGRALAYALSAHCDAIAGPADSEQRAVEASEIVSIARERGDRPMELLGRRLLVLAHLEMGDLPAAIEQMDAFARTAEAIRQPLYGWYVALWKGMRAVLQGRLEDALVHADEAEAVGARAHSVNAPMLAAVLRLVTYFYGERFDDMHVAAGDVERMTGHFGDGYGDYLHATARALSGDLDVARPMVRRYGTTVMPQIPVDAEWLPAAATLAEGVALVGDATIARDLYEQMLPYRSRFAVEGIGAGTYGSIEHHLGLLAMTFGSIAEAEKHFDAALELNRRLGAPLVLARAQRALAALLEERDGPGDRERAQELRTEADAVRRDLGVGDETIVPPASENSFRPQGEFWTLAFDSAIVRMKDAKGLHDIAKLLAQPGREIAALDLATEVGAPKRAAREDALESPGHAGEVLDEQARAEYKERLSELERDIAEAEELGDPVRAERARGERDAIAHELASAYGLGGRARKTGDPAERARTTVTRRIREAIGRIEEAHPALGRHLRSSVKTGTFCVYQPERPVDWAL
jgi:tetratricopeptide (TPR) repeat protein